MRCEASRHFRNKERQYLKYKINDLAINSKNKNIRHLYRGINEFNKGYQPRIYLVNDENGGLIADSNNILNRLKKYFTQLLNVHNVNYVRQIEIHTAESLIPDSHLEVEIAIAMLKKYKSPGSNQILAELIQGGGKTLVFAIHKLINFIWNREERPLSGRSLLMYQFTRRVIKLMWNITAIHFVQKCYQISFFQCYIHKQMKLLGSPLWVLM
jgi:hypothetical protein